MSDGSKPNNDAGFAASGVSLTYSQRASGAPRELETERLTLRCPRAGDGAMLYVSVSEALETLRKFPQSSPWAMVDQSTETCEARCVAGASAFSTGTAFPMLCFLKNSAVHVANVGLHTLDWPNRRCEIGYWCRPSFCGHGYVTEAVGALTRMAHDLLDLEQVVAVCDEANRASWRVCERAGFAFDSVLDDGATPGVQRRYIHRH